MPASGGAASCPACTSGSAQPGLWLQLLYMSQHRPAEEHCWTQETHNSKKALHHRLSGTSKIVYLQGALMHSVRIQDGPRHSPPKAINRQDLCTAHRMSCSPVFLNMDTLAALSAGRSVSSSSRPSCASIARMALRALGRMP